LAKQSVESDFCRKVEDAFTILLTENK